MPRQREQYLHAAAVLDRAGKESCYALTATISLRLEQHLFELQGRDDDQVGAVLLEAVIPQIFPEHVIEMAPSVFIGLSWVSCGGLSGLPEST